MEDKHEKRGVEMLRIFFCFLPILICAYVLKNCELNIPCIIGVSYLSISLAIIIFFVSWFKSDQRKDQLEEVSRFELERSGE